MDDRVALDSLMRVLDTCDGLGLSLHDQLAILSLAWTERAQRLRAESLALPGGFPDEQAWQVEQLEKMARLVSADEPDLELERLHQEGDVQGALDHLQRLLREGGKLTTTAKQDGDYIIYNRTGPDVSGGLVEVYEVTGPDIAQHSAMHRTIDDAKEDGLRRAESKGVSLWYDPDPVGGDKLLQLVETFRP